MTMNQGTITVDDSGNETYIPNDSTNAAMAVYLVLLANSASDGYSAPARDPLTGSILPPIIGPDGKPTFVMQRFLPSANGASPDAKKAFAKAAVATAALIPFIQAHAQVNVTIGQDTISATLPATDKQYTGTLT